MELLTITNTLGALILLLLAVVLIVGASIGGTKNKYVGALLKRNHLKGTEARAIVLLIEETGIFLNEHPQVRMQMQVMPEKGRNLPEIKEVFSPVDLDGIKAGTTLKVKYNPANPKDIILIKTL